MTRRELLDKAAEKTCANREDTFPQIAHFWGCEPLEVCIDMILLKVARIQSGQSVEDSLVDIAGYAACAAEYINKPVSDPLSGAIAAYNLRNGVYSQYKETT